MNYIHADQYSVAIASVWGKKKKEKGFLESFISLAGALISLFFVSIFFFCERCLYDPGAGRFIHPASPTATAAPRTDVLSVSFSASPLTMNLQVFAGLESQPNPATYANECVRRNATTAVYVKQAIDRKRQHFSLLFFGVIITLFKTPQVQT